MIFDIITHRIGSHFLPALINDDWTGLDEGDAALLESWFDWATDDWTDSDGNTWTFAHWGDAHDHDEFAECEVTTLHGDTHLVDAVFTLKTGA